MRMTKLVLVGGLLALGCQDGGSTVEPEVAWPSLECDALVPDYCAFPFPSNVFTHADASTPTGRRLALQAQAMPLNYYEIQTAPDPWNRSDGFSSGMNLMAHLPGATVEGLPTPLTIERSLEPDSPTIVLDAETGEWIPHFSELDRTHDDDARRTFIIRPVVRLADATRYIVAIRGVIDESGAFVEPSPAFRALRDGSASDDESVEARRGLYADIFSRLAEAGVERHSLQLAWDFTTASRESITGGLVSMRDQALAIVGEQGPQYGITSFEPDFDEHSAAKIVGTMTVPLFLTTPQNGGSVVLDAAGNPIVNPDRPWAEYGFQVMVPNSATQTPAALAQHGHGLFSDKREIEWFETPFANTHNYVLFSVDWIGMSDPDQPYVGAVVDSGRFEDFQTVIDRLQQGVVNSLLAMRMMRGRFVSEPMIQYDGRSAIDPTQRFYFGSSQGGIMGGTYMALTTDVERGVLDTAGQPYNLLLTRSEAFDDFFGVIRANYHNPFDIQFLLGMAQILWERASPNGYTQSIREDLLPGTPPHEVVLRIAIGDHQVPTLGAHHMARSIGAVHVDTGIREIWGLENVGPMSSTSAIVEFDFGLPPEPIENLPMRECNDPHDELRKRPEAHQLADHFFRTGEIKSFCSGPCSFPELAGCE